MTSEMAVSPSLDKFLVRYQCRRWENNHMGSTRYEDMLQISEGQEECFQKPRKLGVNLRCKANGLNTPDSRAGRTELFLRCAWECLKNSLCATATWKLGWSIKLHIFGLSPPETVSLTCQQQCSAVSLPGTQPRRVLQGHLVPTCAITPASSYKPSPECMKFHLGSGQDFYHHNSTRRHHAENLLISSLNGCTAMLSTLSHATIIL